MIKWQDAIREVRLLIGTPYSQLDCINLIKKVIRTAPGGVPGYTTAGTNALWESYGSSPKYKDLTWRQMSIAGAAPGMLAFKVNGSDVHHVGLVTESGTVVHSSSGYGEVVETALDKTWDALGIHRYIEAENAGEEMQPMYTAKVKLESSKSLNIRSGPGTDYAVIGKVSNGSTVDVLADTGEAENKWAFIRQDDKSGYVSAAYLVPLDAVLIEPGTADKRMILTDSAGNIWTPVGGFSVKLEAVED